MHKDKSELVYHIVISGFFGLSLGAAVGVVAAHFEGPVHGAIAAALVFVVAAALAMLVARTGAARSRQMDQLKDH